MALESGTYISDLVPTNPAHTDGVNQADSHLRLIKSALKATFPNITGAVTATQDLLNTVASAFGTSNSLVLPGTSPLTLANGGGNLSVSGNIAAPGLTASSYLNVGGTDVASHLVPAGAVIMWSGATTNIPTAWALCDGTQGTPDLRGRFIVGAGGAYSVGVTGGNSTSLTDSQGAHSHGGATGSAGGFSITSQTDAQGSHNHSGYTQPTALTVDQLPSHTHEAPRSSTASVTTGSGTSVTLVEINGVSAPDGPDTSAAGSGNSHNHAIGVDGQHTHSVTLSVGGHTHAIGTDGAHQHSVSVLPPYYSLCYIMKL